MLFSSFSRVSDIIRTLERREFTFQGDIHGKDWEIQAGKARYAGLTWFFKSNIRLVCRWLSWVWRKGHDSKETETKLTTGWKKSPALASKRENISWYKCNQSARHRINILNLQRDTLKNRKKSKVETQRITNYITLRISLNISN